MKFVYFKAYLFSVKVICPMLLHLVKQLVQIK